MPIFFLYFDDFICIIFSDDFKPRSCLHIWWLLQLQYPVQGTINDSDMKRSKPMRDVFAADYK